METWVMEIKALQLDRANKNKKENDKEEKKERTEDLGGGFTAISPFLGC